ncbi:MAG TPA: ATP phosphoribosyltransferase regulatory subunit [Hansschlegelia sp.]
MTPVAIPLALLDQFAAAGFARLELGVLQPAEPFLDVMGEELRQRMFLTSDADGREMCLRPDFTIPAALAHIAGGDPARAASYAYAGPVFRHGANGGEVAQIGVESFGRIDRLAAETEVLTLAVEAAQALGLPSPAIRLGDRALVDAAVGALDAPASLKRRLKREIAHGGSIDTLTTPQRAGESGHAGLFAALEAAGPDAARGVIEDVLSLAGIAAVGGRTPAEIAERFIERAANRSAAIPAAQRQTLRNFLAIDDAAPAALKRLKEILGPGPQISVFEERLDAFSGAGLPVDRMRFSSRIGQGLDYYDGLVFELARYDGADPVGGGGRYDGLLGALGAQAAAPGVGFALWLDRFGAGS